ncbi:MAG: protein adenylyltransferase SelO family protein, partial [Leptolyngbyaceae bacterium]|nr:protein adenylyltransferase SelO family protein [Leptolyngbyaceae bacterium]
EKLEQVSITLARHNPDSVPIRSEIEAIWEPIVLRDDWQPFYELLKQIRHSVID